MDPLICTQIAGKYLITKFLGEGGLGRVFLATHAMIGRTVALKVLHPEFSCDPLISARFALEAKAASKISSLLKNPESGGIPDIARQAIKKLICVRVMNFLSPPI